MNKTNSLDKRHAFWCGFYEFHLYKNKGEAFFKASAITISWIGGVNFSDSTNITSDVAAAFYLFALALIMEYAVQLITAHKPLSKILPFLTLLPSMVVLIATTSILFQRPFGNITCKCLSICTIIPQVIIWIDVIWLLLIEPPQELVPQIENTLNDL